MGNLTSSESESSPHHNRGRSLPEREHDRFEQVWLSMCGMDPSVDRVTSEQFMEKFQETPLIAKSVFVYLSLGNPTIEKEFLENRLLDLIGHGSSPDWETLVESVGLTLTDVLQITLRSESSNLQTECKTLQELQTQFPSIAEIFNRSVIQFVLHFDRWHLSLTPETGLLSSLKQNMIHLIHPNLDLSSQTFLFSLARHGASYRALSASIRHYPGELLVLIQDVTWRTFGFFVNRSTWTETVSEGRAFDELARDTVLFQLSPDLRVRRVNQRGSSNCVYFNVGNSNHVQGIGLGGKEPSFRFCIDGSDIASIRSMGVDATFQSGQVLACDPAEEALVKTRAQNIEIYGFGGETAIAEQQARKAAEEDVRTDRRKVDRMKLVQNEFNREMFFGKTFKQDAAGEDRLGT